MVSFVFAEVNILRFWPKIIVHVFFFGSPKKVLSKVWHLNGLEQRSLMTLVSVT